MQAVDRRPDVDIEEEIAQLLGSFAPLRASRDYYTARSRNGAVRVMGNVRSPQAKRVLVDNIPSIKGVRSLDTTELYDDETIRFVIGQLMPPGLFATIQYGIVALTGKVEGEASIEHIAATMEKVEGVRRVMIDASLRNNSGQG